MSNYIYSFFVYFAECPYFIVISGTCSLLSLLVIVAAIKRHSEKPKLYLSREESSKIIQALLDTRNYRGLFSLSSEEGIDVPGIQLETVSLENSFQFIFRTSGEYTQIYLLQINKKLYLYATLSDKIKKYKYVANSKSNPELFELQKSFMNHFTVPNNNFTSELIQRIKNSC